jgi:hypothetical protein
MSCYDRHAHESLTKVPEVAGVWRLLLVGWVYHSSALENII